MARRKMKCETCKELCGVGKANVEDVRKLEVLYKKLFKCGPDNPLIKYLTRNVFDVLKFKRTSFKMSLLDCIQAGIQKYEAPYQGIGVFAADPDCYTVFGELFDKVLKDDFDFKEEDEHPALDFGDNPAELGTIDSSGNNVLSIRVRCCRDLNGYPFNVCLTEEQYVEIETRIEGALLQLTGEFEGKYERIKDIPDAQLKKLRKERILFQEGNEFLQSAKACEFWPQGRGYFSNKKKNFIVWVNEKDHMRIITMQKGSNLGDVYQRMVNGLTQIEEKLKFAKHGRYGYLSSNPYNLGTAMKVSVHISLPKLGKDIEKLVKAVESNGLQVKGIDCDLSETKNGTFDISNSKSIGITEYELAKGVADGIKALIKEENSLE